MLTKLFKNDFAWIFNKAMWIYYLVLILVTISVKIVENVKQNLFLVMVDKVLVGIFISCCISILITCFMRIWARFITNLYKDESYLTHTLPVTKNQIFNAKVFASILTLIISLLVIVACVAFVYLNENTFEELRVMYDSLVQAYNGVIAVIFVIGLVLLIILEMINMMMAGIFGIISGHRSNNYRMIKSIFIGIAYYFAVAIIIVVTLNIISENLLNEVVTNGFPGIKTLSTMGLTSLALYIISILFFYFNSKRILNKGVNVE